MTTVTSSITLRSLALGLLAALLASPSIHADGPLTFKDAAELQKILDAASALDKILCDSEQTLEVSKSIVISKAITLDGLHARLTPGLGSSPILIVNAEDVTLTNLELHGNFETVDQEERAPLISIREGKFDVRNCRFFDGTKDGIEVRPHGNRKSDLIGGSIVDIEAFRMGRDAISLSGGNEGLKLRDITVTNVSLKRGYHRGAVEVSDGTENINVKNVYAEDALYAVDVQDHKGESASNSHIRISNVEAMSCRHIIRTANSPRGHSELSLSQLKGSECLIPISIKYTSGVTIDGLTILKHEGKEAPIQFVDCKDVTVSNARIETQHFRDKPVSSIKTTNTDFSDITVIAP